MIEDFLAWLFAQLADLPYLAILALSERPWVTCRRCGEQVQWHMDGYCAPCGAIVAGVHILEAHGGMAQTAEQLIERLQKAGWYLSCAEEWN